MRVVAWLELHSPISCVVVFLALGTWGIPALTGLGAFF